eukprot:5212847-Prymnesium_polylepis.3
MLLRRYTAMTTAPKQYAAKATGYWAATILTTHKLLSPFFVLPDDQQARFTNAERCYALINTLFAEVISLCLFWGSNADVDPNELDADDPPSTTLFLIFWG